MDSAAAPTRISRVDSRYRHRAQNVRVHEEEPRVPSNQEEEGPTEAHSDKRVGSGNTMSKGHRFFHRRAGTQVVTVNVEVVATVDSNGSLIAEETRAPVTPIPNAEPTPNAAAEPVIPAEVKPTVPAVAALSAVPEPSAAPQAQQPLPSVPVVPAVPTMPSVPTPALPVVPSVPPFPSDLVVPTVPAYPFASGPLGEVVANSASVTPLPSPANSPESTVTPSPSPDPALVSSSGINSFVNSTLPTTSSLFSSSSPTPLDTLVATILASPVAPSSSLPSASTPATPLTSSSQLIVVPQSSPTPSPDQPSSTEPLTRSISARSTTTASEAAATSSFLGGGSNSGGDATELFGAPPAATTAASADADSAPAPLETTRVVGSVVGSLAGAALILAIILLLLRRHKRKRGGALQITGDDHTDNNQPMVRQAPTSNTLLPAALLPRFSGISGKTAETSTSGGEKSFQRVSGRKLPSAFSEGMTSDQFSRGGTISGSSFYTDDQGTYGGFAVSKEFAKETGDAVRESGQMNFRPSPARTPVIRHPDDDLNPFTDKSYLSPPQSPKFDLPTRGTLGRSLPSQDGSRSSRFTENV